MSKATYQESRPLEPAAQVRARPNQGGGAEEQPPRPFREPEPSGEEIMLAGRRYKLVPLEGKRRELTESLTPREMQIAALVAKGLVNKEIASKLEISEWTVSTHLRRIFAKLGVGTRAAMVSRCARAPDPSKG